MSRAWPLAGAILLFVVILVLIAPWSELPLNDDWNYAHFAKVFAERGTYAIDLPVTASVVGQSLIAWPVLKVFGFSHLALRLLTIALSVLMLVEIDYLLVLALTAPGIRLIALCMIVANPIFLHLSTTFMTENYGYFVALLGACAWFYGRKTNLSMFGVIAAALAGLSFWIRQYCALVFPALLLAEWLAAGAGIRNARTILLRRAPALVVWFAIVGLYFVWAKTTGNYSSPFSESLAKTLQPDLAASFVEVGICFFYLTFFAMPFLVGYGFPKKISMTAGIVFCAFLLTAVYAWFAAVRTGPGSHVMNPTFPFLNNVFKSYGVGPLTLNDVYWQNAQTRPHISEVPWLLLEALIVLLSPTWLRAAAAHERKGEIAIFGVCFGIISLLVVLLAQRYFIFDRYHYPVIIGFTIALAAWYPSTNTVTLRRAASVFIAGLAAFSVLGLHDYFRWQEARARLISRAQARGIHSSEIDAGYESNGWNSVENHQGSAGCGPAVRWFCQARRYRIGLEQRPADQILFSEATDGWLLSFPPLRLLEGP